MQKLKTIINLLLKLFKYMADKIYQAQYVLDTSTGDIDDQVEVVTVASVDETATMVAGETLSLVDSRPTPVYFSFAETNNFATQYEFAGVANGWSNIQGTSAYSGMTWEVTGGITHIEKISFWSAGSTGGPDGDVYVELRDASNNLPGTTLLGTSPKVLFSTISSTAHNQTFEFATPVDITGYDKISFKVINEGGDGSYYFKIFTESSPSDPGVWHFRHTGSALTDRTTFAVITGGSIYDDVEKVYMSDGASAGDAKVHGYITAGASTDADVNVQYAGGVDGFTTLARGATYYVQDGGGLDITAGTNTGKAGRAISATEISLDDLNG